MGSCCSSICPDDKKAAASAGGKMPSQGSKGKALSISGSLPSMMAMNKTEKKRSSVKIAIFVPSQSREKLSSRQELVAKMGYRGRTPPPPPPPLADSGKLKSIKTVVVKEPSDGSHSKSKRSVASIQSAGDGARQHSSSSKKQ